MKFSATLEQSGKTATGIEVPGKIVERLGSGKRPAVQVTINGHTYRSTVAVMGGRYMLSVSADNRDKAGVSAGDKITIDLELDTAPREVTIPRDLAKALKKDARAKKVFDSLSYSHKSRHVLAIEAAKKSETRQRRVEKTIEALREGT